LTIRRAAVEVENADLGFINNDNLGDSLLAIRGEAVDVNGHFGPEVRTSANSCLPSGSGNAASYA
jgi:hypothetical protein